jgi:ferrochelatase
MIHVLLCQVGSIEELHARSVKKYLRRFLSDDRIIDLPKIFWRPFLELVVAVRHKKVLKLYRDIWTHDGSPLYAISQQQRHALQEELGGDYSVELFLSFTDSNSIDSVYTKMKHDGLDHVVVIPLFPQFSTATTSGVADTVFSKLLGWKKHGKKEKVHIPNIHFISNFYNNTAYKALYLAHIKNQIALLQNPPDTLIVSFHGLPKRYIDEGDSYQQHCEETFGYIKDAFGKDNIELVLSYQSRFGAEEWLGPRTEDVIKNCALSSPHKTVAVVCPGFVTDCLETLSEIKNELHHTYQSSGGNAPFFYIPCLNTSKEFIQFLATSIKNTTSGFV